jgi:hypothetical protein
MDGINRIAREFGDKIFFEVVNDMPFMRALDTKHKRYHAFLDYPAYRALIRKCDIALLPLEDNRFNRHKTDVKFIECAAEGCVVLASKVVYENTVKHRRFGFLYESPEDFEKQLHKLVKFPEMRSDRAPDAFTYIKIDRLLSKHYRDRHEWYKSLLERKDELDAKLKERAPELFEES